MDDEFNPVKGLFDLIGKKIDADAQARERTRWLDDARLYGVNEYGQPYYRGSATPAPGAGAVSPLVAIGVAILAVTLVVWATKS